LVDPLAVCLHRFRKIEDNDMPPTNPKNFLTTSQTARKFAVHPKTIDRWAKDPTLNLPKPTVVNKRRYFDEAQLDKWATGRAEDAA